jgi:hypothetical protein
LSFKLAIKCSIVFLCLLSPASFATWYQGSAEQPVGLLNFDAIRTQTIKRAIANASMQSNSYIQVENIVLDGLLQSSKTILRSEGQIRRVEILSESLNDDVLSVTVKVDIKPLISCQKDPYSKSLLVAQFPLLKPSQAAHGALFDLGAQTSRRFEKQLSSSPKILVNSLLSKSVIPDDSEEMSRYLESVGRYLATEYDSQFILFGAIRDLSLFEQVKDNLLIDDVLLRRNFTIELYLYDGFRGSILLQKNYHGEANWLYENNHNVDTNNSVFWRTDYGRSVLHTINGAVTDINDVLSCQQSLSQIISHENGQLVINIGKNQGVQVGDEFELVTQRVIDSGNGKTRILHSVDHSRTLNVVQVNNQSAVLTSESLSFLTGNQLFNLVSPKSVF